MPGISVKEQQLVGLQRDGGGGGHLFHRQVERLAGGREAERTQQHQCANVDGAADGARIDAAHDARMHVVDAVDDSDRARSEEVA
jgi:hypothetical protein